MSDNDYFSGYFIHTITHRADHAYFGTTLIAAGIVPSFFSSANLSAIYFALLIPPAAWHCYLWIRKAFLPELQQLFSKIRTIKERQNK